VFDKEVFVKLCPPEGPEHHPMTVQQVQDVHLQVRPLGSAVVSVIRREREDRQRRERERQRAVLLGTRRKEWKHVMNTTLKRLTCWDKSLHNGQCSKWQPYSLYSALLLTRADRAHHLRRALFKSSALYREQGAIWDTFIP
jgi:hypothetical protein